MANRQQHGDQLLQNLDHLSEYWANNLTSRKEQQLPDLPDSNIVPVFLQIDSDDLDVESLKGFGVEIIAEEEGGFIIGASSVDFKSLKEKIQKFVTEQGKSKNQAAILWQINDGLQWKIDEILSDDLKNKWGAIRDDSELVVDIGIACYIRISNQPEKKRDTDDAKFDRSYRRWQARKENLEQERDNIAIKRQTDFEVFVRAYGGEFLSGYTDYDDSFSCRIKISGKGLKDIVLNYQYLFEVIEYDPLIITNESTGDIENINPNLIAPQEGYPSVCIIDSGIQEEHRLLSAAIDRATSVSFIPNDASTADTVGGGGHGTRVAGAILYPQSIPRTGDYQLPCFIQNARVLSNSGQMSVLPQQLFPPQLMKDVTENFEGTRIFNMSINAHSACKTTHMSQWAAAIDKLMFEGDILFILSAGNIPTSNSALKPGITDHLNAGRNYPQFLLEQSSRIANPAQSCFALTVGSVCLQKFDNGLKESFGEKDSPSSFSRTGLALWGMIKPDVVEYGGDFVKEKNGNNISKEVSIAPELVRSTFGGGSGVGNDSVGTSYAAPKVAHIAATLQRLYPNDSANLYRALIVQSARLPEAAFLNPTFDHIRYYGYGIPDLRRATENSEKRVTLLASEKIPAKQAHIYSIKVPAAIRSQGEDFDVLIEVTLSFMAKTRRTRRRTKSYLSTWLDWQSCKLDETHDQFVHRVIQNIEAPEAQEETQGSIKWVIRERTDWSLTNGVRRQDSSLQKSWCKIKSFQLPEVFNIAVVGHKGWECDLNEEVPYSIAVSFELLSGNINIYEMIRVENEIQVPVEVEEVSIRVNE